MPRRFLSYSLILLLGITTVSCGGTPTADTSPTSTAQSAANTSSASRDRLSDGQYPVQQVSFNDADGEYSLMLLNTKPGEASVLRTTELQMARLTDADIKAGKKTYLKVEAGKPALYLTEDFKISYVHNVTETRPNAQTGQPQTVVVRQESSFWTPFAGALAGQALGSLLFTPQYYLPPVYSPGAAGLSGYGGYGSSYDRAVSSYQTRYKAPPVVEKNRQAFRTTGQLRNSGNSTSGLNSTKKPQETNRSTGSGFGGSTLNRNNSSGSSNNPSPSSSFGSSSRPKSGFGTSRPRSGGFGGFRRRR